MIPGMNILNSALSVIASQTLNYYQNTGVTVGVDGSVIPVYAAVARVQGSFQPVPRSMYREYGLDFAREYFNFYVSANVIGVDRDKAGDQVGFAGLRYNCESVTPWKNIDGWNAVLCVKVSDD